MLINAAISGICTIIGSLCGILASARLTIYRIEQLEKKVDKHNNLVDRMYILEEAQKVDEERIKVINHRIQDLEGGKEE